MNDLQQQDNTPGFGAAGLVFCPLMKSPCMKQGCEWWVELTYGDKKVARCSMAWLTVLGTETRQAIDRLKETTSDNNNNQ